MQNILTGIYSAYNADADLKAALPGEMHFELAPVGTSMTYATYQEVTGRPEYIFEAKLDEVVLIQFDIYASTNALRQTAYDKLIAVYDDSIISATGYTPVIFERINYQFLREGVQNEIFRAIVEYQGDWRKN